MKVLRRLSFAHLCLCVSTPLFAGFGSTETFLPAVGRVPGQGGAQFYTTVWATNLTAAPQTMTFRFLKQGQANGSPPSFVDTLQPGETKVYENVVESKLGLNSAIGAARVTSTGEIFVSERIFNQAPGADLGSTEGLFFAGVPKSFSISAGQSASIQGINQGGAENFRYNFALVETGGGSPTVNVQVFDGSGTLLGQKAYSLLPYEQLQPGVGEVVAGIKTTNARITATVTGGTGSVLLAGAQLANISQDSSGFEMSFRDDLLGGGGGPAGVTSLNGLTGALTLTPGSGISITPSGSSISIAYTGGGAGGITSVTHDASLSGAGTGASPLSIANGQVVRSVNGVHDNVTLAAGSNVTITPSGSTLTIASSGGGGGGLTLPFLGSIDLSYPPFQVINNGSSAGSSAIAGTSMSATASAVMGTGAGTGVSGQGVVGVSGIGNAAHTTGVYGRTGGDAASGEGGWAGVWGDSHDSTAVQGTSFNDRGVLGITNSATAIAAVEGLNRSTGGTGVLGRTGSGAPAANQNISDEIAGVWGDAGGTGTGVLGTAVDAGVVGLGNLYGVLGGGLTKGDVTGVEGIGSSGVVGQGSSYGVYSLGNFGGTGAKYFVEPHPTDPTKEIRYVCLEGRESGTYFRGTGRIVRGFATIEVPEDFSIVTSPKGITVQLTPVGDLAVLAVMRQGLDGIVIRGSSDVEFHYMVNGVRRALEDHAPISENRDFIPRSADGSRLTIGLPAESLRRLKENGTLNEDGSVNLETAHRLGWDSQESWKRAEAGNKGN
jgi:hypothetical protein